MISLQALVLLTFTILIAAIATSLTLATGANWPTALLTGGAAGGATLGLLPQLIDDKNDQDS